MNRQTGDIIWSLEIDGVAVDAPALAEDTVVIGATNFTVDGWVYAIDLETRQPRWVYETENRSKVRTSTAIAEGLVLFGDSDGRLNALDFETGELEWSFDSNSDFLTSPTVADLLVYFGDVDGAVIAVDLITGVERWRFQTDLGQSAPTRCFGTTCGRYSPVIRGGSLFIGNPAGYLYALEYSTSTSEVN